MLNEIIRLHREGKPIWAIKQWVDASNGQRISPQRLTNLLRSAGETIKKGRRTYRLNENVFDAIDTEAKAYWLGFLYADGYVTKNGKYVNLALSRKDRDHIVKWTQFLESDQPIIDYFTTSARKDGIPASRISIYSPHMVRALARVGCVNAKSLTLRFPTNEQVPAHLIHHFIRGYFDGDGSIQAPADGRHCGVSFVGTEDMLAHISDLIQDAVRHGKHKVPRKGRSIYEIQYGGKHLCQRVVAFLYRESTVSLTRKRERAESITRMPCITKGESHHMAKEYRLWNIQEGKEIRVKNLSQFARDNGYTKQTLYNIVNGSGRSKTHRGLTAVPQ